MPKNNEAWIYVIEDINDNRYVGSTGEKRLEDRLSTHKKDERNYYFGKRKGKCSSMKLNLHNAVIKPLMKCENNWDVRTIHESHYINNVYPECVNENRLNCHSLENKKKRRLKYEKLNKEKIKENRKIYYQQNREKQIKQAIEWRDKNRDKVNAKRREHYQKNKEKILKQKKERYIRSKLKNKI
jgi:hypothetical protein